MAAFNKFSQTSTIYDAINQDTHYMNHLLPICTKQGNLHCSQYLNTKIIDCGTSSVTCSVTNKCSSNVIITFYPSLKYQKNNSAT